MRTPRALARSRPSPVRVRMSSRSNSANPARTVSISRPCGEVVSAHESRRERKPAPRSPTAARVLRRSLVDRARRSRRVTSSKSPFPNDAIARCSWARPVTAPLTFSRVDSLCPGRSKLAHLGIEALSVCGDPRVSQDGHFSTALSHLIYAKCISLMRKGQEFRAKFLNYAQTVTMRAKIPTARDEQLLVYQTCGAATSPGETVDDCCNEGFVGGDINARGGS